jgi:lipopolysaccharide export system protein LptA
MRPLGLSLILPTALVSSIALTTPWQSTKAQTAGDGRALTLRADVQEANAQTGIVTARGNVQINYPARQIQATAAQAQYFSRERRIVLSGNVYVLQKGNSIRAETVTYLIDEGRFTAIPKAEAQVESTYIVPEQNASTQPQVAPVTPPFNPKTPVSAPPAPRQ